MVGMRDVAKKAGVSLSTVSLVVNGTGYVSQEMRDRVEAAMRELDYIPNELARNLFSGRTSLVGGDRADDPASVLLHHDRGASACAGRTRSADHAVLDGGYAHRRGRVCGHAAPAHDGRDRDGGHTSHAPDYWTRSTARWWRSTGTWGRASPRWGRTTSRAGDWRRRCWCVPGRGAWWRSAGPRAQFHDFVDWAQSRRGAAGGIRSARTRRSRRCATI